MPDGAMWPLVNNICCKFAMFELSTSLVQYLHMINPEKASLRHAWQGGISETYIYRNNRHMLYSKGHAATRDAKRPFGESHGIFCSTPKFRLKDHRPNTNPPTLLSKAAYPESIFRSIYMYANILQLKHVNTAYINLNRESNTSGCASHI